MVTKSGINWCKLPLKTTDEGEEEEDIQKGLVAAEDISVDASVAVLFFITGWRFQLKKNKEGH